MSSVIVSSKGEKKKSKKKLKKIKINGFRRKLGFPECDIILPSEYSIIKNN